MVWTEVLLASLAFGVLWVVLCWPYRSYREDLLRQRLFELRDELFDFAADEQMSFDSKAYGSMRSLLHAYMRNACEMTLTHVVLFSRATRHDPQLLNLAKKQFASFEAVLSTESEGVKAKLEDIHRRATFAVVEHIIACSPFFWAAVVPVVATLVIRTLLVAIDGRIRKVLSSGREAEAIAMMGLTTVDELRSAHSRAA